MTILVLVTFAFGCVHSDSTAGTPVISIGIRENGGAFFDLAGKQGWKYQYNHNKFELSTIKTAITGMVDTNSQPHKIKLDIQTKTPIVIEFVGMENPTLDQKKLNDSRIHVERGSHRFEISGTFVSWNEWNDF